MKSKYVKLWEEIKKSTMEKKQEIINQLSDEDLVELRYITNPYRLPMYKSTAKFLEFSFINSPKDYMANLMMTSMVGFIYKMASEFKYYNGKDSKYPSEQMGDFALQFNNKLKEFNLHKVENHYKAIYKKTGKLEDKARYNRAKLVVMKKRLDADEKLRSELEPQIEKQEKYVINFCNSNKIKYESVFPTEIPISADEIECIKQQVKKDMCVKKTKEEHESQIQDYILDFLDEYFNYDPNNHIRCGYMPQYDEKLKNANLKTINTQRGTEMLVTKDFEKYLIPPLDTFHSFKNYYDTNYEYLRQCTNDIYGKTDFDFAILAREVFSTETKAQDWERKYKNELDVSCYRIPFNEWIFLDPWEKNRDKITYDDEKTKLIKEILERKKEEEKLGKQLIGKKARKMQGKTSDKLPFNSQAEELGAERLSKMSKDNESFRSEDDVEIKIYSTKLLRNKRGVKTQDNNFAFDIPSEKPKLPN